MATEMNKIDGYFYGEKTLHLRNIRMQKEENMATYQVIEYRSTADTYEVEASSEEDAENQVAEGMGTLIPGLRYEEHDFYEVKEN